MNRILGLAVLIAGTASATAAAPLPKPFITGLKNPESVCIGPDGRLYVTVIGDFDKDGDGGVMVIDNGKAVPFATGMDDPKGMIAWKEFLYVTDKTRVWRVDKTGKAEVFVSGTSFPTTPRFLNDIEVDEGGTLYVSDSGDLMGKGGAVYRINPRGDLVELILDTKRCPALNLPNGLAMDGASHLLLVDAGSGELMRIKLATLEFEKLAEGFGGGDGLTWDKNGRLFITDWKNGKVFVIPRPGAEPILIAEGFQSAADSCLDATGKFLIVPDMKAGTITALPAVVPGAPVDVSPLGLEPVVAFPDLQWTGWKGETDAGTIVPLRPIVLTHAGDGSNRVFVATQQGVIHVFPNNQKAKKTEIFIDLQDRVVYDDKTNEEGFLGFTFHPKFKETGEFFVFYTPKKGSLVNHLSRFKVSGDDPKKGDPASEEILLKIERPYWNHDGGTICFGPDGHLYVALGDGGAANDPYGNAQNLQTLLGKILRLDVDHKMEGKNYGIPKDNPFVGKKDGLPEIWAYGLRNVWRMAFDRPTKQLWAADVGQNLYEEIDLIKKGGNYGWNLREGLHPFGARGVGPRKDLIEPIWEYSHDVGKSITGGAVYHGTRLPELAGLYVYGDYVSGKTWALRYDSMKKRVVANHPLRDRALPIMSFGEDEKGEIYFMTYSPTGKGIYRFEKVTDEKK